MKHVAIILSGCGARDGSEIREAISLLISLSKNNIKYTCFSINKKQAFVFNHLTNEIEEGASRNVLQESARIARGKVQDIKNLNPSEFDGIAFPGGYGAVINLSDFAIVKNTNFKVEESIEKAILSFYKQGKPMLFLCISPMIISKILGNVKITLGQKSEITQAAEILGSEVVHTSQNSPVVDEKNKIVTVPCYMLEIKINELYDGIFASVEEFKKLLER